MLETLKSWFNYGTVDAKASPTATPSVGPSTTILPTQPTPKVGAKQLSLPSYLTTAKPSTTSPLLRADRTIANLDITSYRTGSDTRQVIQDFTRTSPDLSAAVTAYVRTGITSGYTAIARNPDGTANPDATSALSQILMRLNVLNDYSVGFDDGLSLRALSEVFARELVTQGACAAELVLDQARLPDKILPIATAQIRFYPSDDALKLVPNQYLAGVLTSLDVPTFFMIKLDEDLSSAYPVSPIEPAIQAVIFSAQFMNDVRKVVQRAIHPRITVTIDEDAFLKAMPPSVQNDEEAFVNYRNSAISTLQASINGLNPEDAFVKFSSVGIQVIDHGNTNLSNEYTMLQGMADAKLAAGAKVLPTVLGHSNATSNVASAETLMFLKFVEGTVWSKLNEMFSKILTLAVRLLGYDIYVDFKYNTIDLKPDSELEAFKAMKQSRYLDLLSLGMIEDAECAIELTGHLPPTGYVALSGSGFRSTGTTVLPAGDGFNGATTNKGPQITPTSTPDTPTSPKGVKKS